MLSAADVTSGASCTDKSAGALLVRLTTSTPVRAFAGRITVDSADSSTRRGGAEDQSDSVLRLSSPESSWATIARQVSHCATCARSDAASSVCAGTWKKSRKCI